MQTSMLILFLIKFINIHVAWIDQVHDQWRILLFFYEQKYYFGHSWFCFSVDVSLLIYRKKNDNDKAAGNDEIGPERTWRGGGPFRRDILSGSGHRPSPPHERHIRTGQQVKLSTTRYSWQTRGFSITHRNLFSFFYTIIINIKCLWSNLNNYN